MDKVQIQNTNAEKYSLQLIQNHLKNGLKEMNTFVSNLLEKRADLTEREIIDQILTPTISTATSAFGDMADSAEKLLCDINNSLEINVLQCKEMSDTEKQLNATTQQLEKKLKLKQMEITEAEDNLRNKKHMLAEAKKILEQQEGGLRQTKEIQSTVEHYASIAGNFFSPSIGQATHAVTHKIADATFKQCIDGQREIVKSCADQVSLWQSEVKVAEKGKNETLGELRSINDKLKYTSNKLKQCQENQKSLKKMQESIIEFNQRFKRCFRLLKKLQGCSEVLHLEVHGGYLLDIFIEPTKDLYASLLSLSQCTGFRQICGDTTFEIETKYKSLEFSMTNASKSDDLV